MASLCWEVDVALVFKPVQALKRVHINSVAAGMMCSNAVSDMGEVWAWGCDAEGVPPLGQGDETDWPHPETIAALRGIKIDAVVAHHDHRLALADNGRVYVWGSDFAAVSGALGLGPSDGETVSTPQRIQTLRVTCGL
jgi:alpha-tubulin suppressor-like RCC1 family protein